MAKTIIDTLTNTFSLTSRENNTNFKNSVFESFPKCGNPKGNGYGVRVYGILQSDMTINNYYGDDIID